MPESTTKPDGKVLVTQMKSGHGQKPGQLGTLRGLGLNKPRSTSTLVATESVRGMLRKVAHLIKVEELS